MTMENGNVIEADWQGVLVQWSFLFVLLTVIAWPAFKFANLASAYKRSGWAYFILGLFVGIIGLNLGHVVLFPLRYYYDIPQQYSQYLIAVLFVSGYLFYRFSYRFLKGYFERHGDKG